MKHNDSALFKLIRNIQDIISECYEYNDFTLLDNFLSEDIGECDKTHARMLRKVCNKIIEICDSRGRY